MKQIKARYTSKCGECETTVVAGGLIWWEKGKAARCVGCGPTGQDAATEAESLTSGHAGQSAALVAEKKKEAWEKYIRSEHKLLGGILLYLNPESYDAQNWRVGASGERAVGARLDALVEKGCGYVLHDRKVPKSSANIDHLWVSDKEVWIVDSKRWTGKVEDRNVGGWFRPDWRLYVAGRDRSKTVASASKTAEKVQAVVEGAGLEVKVRSSLCFIESTWEWFSKPFWSDGVLCLWPGALEAHLPQSENLELALSNAVRLAKLYPQKN